MAAATGERAGHRLESPFEGDDLLGGRSLLWGEDPGGVDEARGDIGGDQQRRRPEPSGIVDGDDGPMPAVSGRRSTAANDDRCCTVSHRVDDQLADSSGVGPHRIVALR